MSLMVIAVAVLAVAGGTFAKFADSTTSVENKFTAGNVSISVNGENPASLIFNPTDIKPGDTNTSVIHLQNVGSVRNCIFDMAVSLGDHSPNHLLASKIDVELWEDKNHDGVQGDGEPTLNATTLTKLKTVELTKPDDTYLVFKWTFNESAEEEYMDAWCTANITFTARQP